MRAFLKFRANIPPRWIRNARNSRKRIEPNVVRSLSKLERLRKNPPRARVATEVARKELKAVLRTWEIAYNKENFYRGIRVLLELCGTLSEVADFSGGFGRGFCVWLRPKSPMKSGFLAVWSERSDKNPGQHSKVPAWTNS